MVDKQQTAVEWLVEQMRIRKEQGLTLSLYDLEIFAEQAKQMEKDQIEESYAIGYTNCEVGIKYREQYYNETYGKDEKNR